MKKKKNTKINPPKKTTAKETKSKKNTLNKLVPSKKISTSKPAPSKKTKEVKEKNQKIEKRWRPPKLFIYQKPQVKREWPGRPKKSEKYLLPEIPEKTENKSKDLVILILFILSFIIFWFSVYVNIDQKAEKNQETKQTELMIKIAESIPEVKDEKEIIVEEIYSALQNENFEEIYSHIDSSLKKSSIFQTFFSTNRLKRFINNIDNKKIELKINSIEENTIQYSISYTINQTVYTEEREANFIKRNEQQKINKIMCTNSWCSKLPFFNPKRYF
jgi:hypothetical protein